MVTMGSLRRKFKSAIVRPDQALRVLLLGRFNSWPVARLENADMRDMTMYCISLSSSTQRRSLMQRQARSMGLTNFHFVDACDASTLNVSKLEAEGLYDAPAVLRHHGRPLSPGAIACSLSHGRVYDLIVAERLPYAIILEDDALFIPGELDQVRLAELPSDFDVVFLNAFLTREPPNGRISGNLFTDESYGGSSAAYLVSRAGAEKLAGAYKPVAHAADGLLGRSMKVPAGQTHPFKQQGARTEITTYIVYPHCVLNGSTWYFTGTTLF